MTSERNALTRSIPAMSLTLSTLICFVNPLHQAGQHLARADLEGAASRHPLPCAAIGPHPTARRHRSGAGGATAPAPDRRSARRRRSRSRERRAAFSCVRSSSWTQALAPQAAISAQWKGALTLSGMALRFAGDGELARARRPRRRCPAITICPARCSSPGRPPRPLRRLGSRSASTTSWSSADERRHGPAPPARPPAWRCRAGRTSLTASSIASAALGDERAVLAERVARREQRADRGWDRCSMRAAASGAMLVATMAGWVLLVCVSASGIGPSKQSLRDRLAERRVRARANTPRAARPRPPRGPCPSPPLAPLALETAKRFSRLPSIPSRGRTSVPRPTSCGRRARDYHRPDRPASSSERAYLDPDAGETRMARSIRMTDAPQEMPAPSAQKRTVLPGLMRPSRTASSRAMGIDALDVLPYALDVRARSARAGCRDAAATWRDDPQVRLMGDDPVASPSSPCPPSVERDQRRRWRGSSRRP